MENDVRSRKWLVTINNPVEKGFNHNAIKAQLQLFKNCAYWCMSDEIGKDVHFALFGGRKCVLERSLCGA